MDQPINRYHQRLTLERWRQLSIAEQMANIGNDVIRALTWRRKGKREHAQAAVERALELLHLSLDAQTTYSRLKEFARLREVVVDYFYGENLFGSSDTLWHSYFDPYNYLARKDR